MCFCCVSDDNHDLHRKLGNNRVIKKKVADILPYPYLIRVMLGWYHDGNKKAASFYARCLFGSKKYTSYVYMPQSRAEGSSIIEKSQGSMPRSTTAG